MHAPSVWSCEVCQLSTGTRMEVSLTRWSWQRLDAAPPGSIRSWGLVCTVSTERGDTRRRWPGVPPPGRRTAVCDGGLTQEGRVSVSEREPLVPGNAEGSEHVEALVQEGLEAGGRGIGGVEQVVDLLTGGAQGRHWRTHPDEDSERTITRKTRWRCQSPNTRLSPRASVCHR